MTSTSSQGGGTQAGCKSNSDCAYPYNLCDVASGNCVECLINSVCLAKPGTVCSMAACVCPLDTDTFCPADGYGPARCSPLDDSASDCGQCGHQCFGACVSGACTDAWEPVAADGAPSARANHVAVWTGSVMIVWGGSKGNNFYSDGAEYNPSTRTWTPISDLDAPSPRDQAVAAWTGSEMIVWGGRDAAGPLGDGASYNPVTKKWSTLPVGGPTPRYQTAAVWTGNPARFFVWGGYDGTELATGGYYTSGGSWFELAAPMPPSARRLHTAVWDDMNSRVILFGGLGFDPNSMTTMSLASGGIYGPLPANEAWTDLIGGGSPPAPRYEHTAVWAGTHMIVWGGFNDGIGVLGDGARFNAAGNNEWSAMNGVAPAARQRHTAVYFKSLNKMVVWGGYGAGNAILDDGGVFNVAAASWSPTGLPSGPSGAVNHTAVVADNRMIVWGGLGPNGVATNKGAVLDMTKVP